LSHGQLAVRFCYTQVHKWKDRNDGALASPRQVVLRSMNCFGVALVFCCLLWLVRPAMLCSTLLDLLGNMNRMLSACVIPCFS